MVVVAGIGHLGGDLLAWGDVELVSCLGDIGQAQDLNGRRWAGNLDVLALVVDQRTDTAPCSTRDHRIADLEGAFLHQHGRDRATADVEVRFQHDTLGASVGVGTKFLDLGDQQDLVEQFIDTDVLQSRNLLGDDVAAEGLGDEFCLLYTSPSPRDRQKSRMPSSA